MLCLVSVGFLFAGATSRLVTSTRDSPTGRLGGSPSQYSDIAQK